MPENFRSASTFATELPTVPKPSRATFTVPSFFFTVTVVVFFFVAILFALSPLNTPHAREIVSTPQTSHHRDLQAAVLRELSAPRSSSSSRRIKTRRQTPLPQPVLPSRCSRSFQVATSKSRLGTSGTARSSYKSHTRAARNLRAHGSHCESPPPRHAQSDRWSL